MLSQVNLGPYEFFLELLLALLAVRLQVEGQGLVQLGHTLDLHSKTLWGRLHLLIYRIQFPLQIIFLCEQLGGLGVMFGSLLPHGDLLSEFLNDPSLTRESRQVIFSALLEFADPLLPELDDHLVTCALFLV